MKTAQNKLSWIKIKIRQFGCHDALGGWLLSRETGGDAGEDGMAVRGKGVQGNMEPWTYSSRAVWLGPKPLASLIL